MKSGPKWAQIPSTSPCCKALQILPTAGGNTSQPETRVGKWLFDRQHPTEFCLNPQSPFQWCWWRSVYTWRLQLTTVLWRLWQLRNSTAVQLNPSRYCSFPGCPCRTCQEPSFYLFLKNYISTDLVCDSHHCFTGTAPQTAHLSAQNLKATNQEDKWILLGPKKTREGNDNSNSQGSASLINSLGPIITTSFNPRIWDTLAPIPWGPQITWATTEDWTCLRHFRLQPQKCWGASTIQFLIDSLNTILPERKKTCVTKGLSLLTVYKVGRLAMIRPHTWALLLAAEKYSGHLLLVSMHLHQVSDYWL